MSTASARQPASATAQPSHFAAGEDDRRETESGLAAATMGTHLLVAAAATEAADGGNRAIEGVFLRRPTHVWQKWNNCAPSALAMALGVFGVQRDQFELAALLKPDREDTNVSPEEIAVVARSEGMSAVVRYNGGRDVVRNLVRSGVPVIAEQWIDVDGRGEMGHYRVVTGFSDADEAFEVQDSYYGANRRLAYEDFERMWRPFVGAYVVVFDPVQELAVRAALGADHDEDSMWHRALEDCEAWADHEPESAWPPFACGEILGRLDEHAEAVRRFERAIEIGLPTRAFWYQFGFYRSLVAIGAYDRAIAHADATLATMNGENLEESRFWKGIALRALGREEEARFEFEAALRFNPRFEAAREALDADGRLQGGAAP